MDVKPEETRRSVLEIVFEPWELEGGSKRDCISHRADLLKLLTKASFIAGCISVFAFPLLIPSLVAIVTGLSARMMAARDLVEMRAGEMEHRGYRATEKAWFDSQVGMILSLVGFIFWLFPGALLLALYRFHFGPGGL
jgi:hypothetical protein